MRTCAGAFCGASAGLFLLVLGSSIFAAAAPAAAQLDRVVVWIADDGDRALSERVAGQLSDLDVEPVAVELGPHAATAHAQLQTARSAADELGAIAVVWLERRTDRDAPSLRVVLLDASRDRVFRRELGSAPDPAARSALLEQAAVAIRTVVRSVLEGREIGVAAEEVVAADDKADAPPPATPDPARQEPPPAPERARSSRAVRPSLSAGWRMLADPGNGLRFHGVALGAGAWIADVVVGVEGGFGFPTTLSSGIAEFSVRRHEVAGRAALRRPLSEVFRIDLGIRGGAALFRRNTNETAAGAIPTDAAMLLAGFAGAETRLSWAPVEGLVLALSVGAEVLLPRPRFGYIDADERHATHTLAAIQLQGALWIGVEL